MKRNPTYCGSRALRALVWFAAASTVAILLVMILDLTIKGLPYVKGSLCAWTYTSENVSLVPAAVNT